MYVFNMSEKRNVQKEKDEWLRELYRDARSLDLSEIIHDREL